jgi:nucleotide-binding universal stress UspA family protein
MKKILFPTDFSECANNALPFALDLTKKNNAKLIIVHVYYMSVVQPIDRSVPIEVALSSADKVIYEALEKRMKRSKREIQFNGL